MAKARVSKQPRPLKANTETRAALGARGMRDVLQYWLALLRYQEALEARPRARKVAPGASLVPNISDPSTGQDYTKLPFSGSEELLVAKTGHAELEFDAERAQFFEDWLAGRYRRGEDDEGARAEHLLCFPALHLPQGNLAALLRFPVEVQFKLGDKNFRVPSYHERMSKRFPEAPTTLRVRVPKAEASDALPYFIDGKVLREVLRIDAEAIDAFFSALRSQQTTPRAMVEAVSLLIATQTEVEQGQSSQALQNSQASQSSPGATAGASKLEPEPTKELAHGSAAQLARLHRLVQERLLALGSRARVYDVALLINSDRMRATWHLQRDITEVLEMDAEGGLGAECPLVAYLAGRVNEEGDAPSWGRFSPSGLTASQERALERALGSELCAVQGPPGTGKTTLILNLLAHTLVEKVMTLADAGAMGDRVTVVTSTNNQAVDNVLDPLGKQLDKAKLPLGLRVGNRDVIESVTHAELTRAWQWLKQRDVEPERAKAELAAALTHFAALRAELAAQSAPKLQRLEHTRDLARARAELERLREGQQEHSDLKLKLEQALREAFTFASEVDPAAAARELATVASDTVVQERVAVSFRPWIERLNALSALTGAPQEHVVEARLALRRVELHYATSQRTVWPSLRDLLAVPLAEPAVLLERAQRPIPDKASLSEVQTALEAWEEAVESALAPLLELELALEAQKSEAKRRQQIAVLERELARLDSVVLPAAPPVALSNGETDAQNAQHYALFIAASEVRECWAVRHRSALLHTLDHALKLAKSSKSLKTLFEARSAHADWLRQLFPAWGCTLLSLGNVFPPTPEIIHRVVIDEAGQCHSAYAVSALLRATSALVIGDVHQLEPVVGLGLDDEHRIVSGLKLSLSERELAPYRMYDGSKTSAQSLADRAVSQRPTLTDHFRCQPAIIAICESLCGYGLVAHTKVRTRQHEAPFLRAPVLFHAINGEQERAAGSWVNVEEVRAVVDLVEQLLRTGIRAEEVGVITPYRGQVERLWRALREARVPLERPPAEAALETLDLFGGSGAGLAIGTVHRFQGGERSIIVFSSTVTRVSSLPFVDERVNLLNVAVSRAREHFITLGHRVTLTHGVHTRRILERAEPLPALR